jgi:hypothetical protein
MTTNLTYLVMFLNKFNIQSLNVKEKISEQPSHIFSLYEKITKHLKFSAYTGKEDFRILYLFSCFIENSPPLVVSP